jgi:ribonuclease G
MPEAEGKIELFTGPGVLFDLYDIEEKIEQLLRPRVPLPSGGWITIEGTEALTAVDVNSGSFTASTGLEETSLKVNLEAADEIGRQLILRGVGGLIVIDFIHVSEPDNIRKFSMCLPRVSRRIVRRPRSRPCRNSASSRSRASASAIRSSS